VVAAVGLSVGVGDLAHGGGAPLVRRALDAVIAAEGPVQHVRLARLVASASDSSEFEGSVALPADAWVRLSA
jgi:hypothetical protein